MFLHILGFIIDDYSSALIDVNVDEFDKIETLFLNIIQNTIIKMS